MAETKKPERPVHYWWHGRDLCDFFAEVSRLGAENVRIEFHPTEGLLHVVPVARAEEDEAARAPGPGRKTFDFTHTCPPDCH